MTHNRNDKARMNVWMKVVMDNSTADARLSIQFYNDNHKWQHVFMLVGDRFQISKTREFGPGVAVCETLSTATEHGPAMAEHPL